MKKTLVTGGAGFIGSEFVRQKAKESKIVVVDKLTYAGDMRRLRKIGKKIIFYPADITNAEFMEHIFRENEWWWKDIKNKLTRETKGFWT